MSNISDRLNKVASTLDNQKVSKVAFEAFKDATPVRSGNAKRNTKLSNNTIEADYSYAGVLDKGRQGKKGSDQAPQGMSKPALEAVRDYVQNNLGIDI